MTQRSTMHRSLTAARARRAPPRCGLWGASTLETKASANTREAVARVKQIQARHTAASQGASLRTQATAPPSMEDESARLARTRRVNAIAARGESAGVDGSLGWSAPTSLSDSCSGMSA